MKQEDLKIKTLGKCDMDSPLASSGTSCFIGEDELVYLYAEKKNSENEVVEVAGPRHKIYFNPVRVSAAIATCGGICPGLNNIIRSVVRCLWHSYGVRRIRGIRYGYNGLLADSPYPFMDLDPDLVDDIQGKGGTILGSGRGGGDRVSEIVDTLEKMNINMFFTIGGDGTLRGADDIQREIERRNLKISVIGIPKTIDNDLGYIQSSFGVDTAVSLAANTVRSAHVEAKGAVNGIGLVKVMGRAAGFIAANTALAQNDVNFCLVPESPFDIDGENGFLHHLEERIKRRGHAVVLVAEGAGQELLPPTGKSDASGNVKFADIGVYLKESIKKYFESRKLECNVKYIDPSYIIRSAPADSYDSIYCARLGAHAVHAAMCGKTGLVVSLLHNNYVYLPISLVVSKKNCIDLNGSLWRDVLENTSQPQNMKNS